MTRRLSDLLFHIQEAKIHLQNLETDLEHSSDIEPISLLTWLGHVQEHLCLAWNCATAATPDPTAANKIPNWTLDFELILPEYVDPN